MEAEFGGHLFDICIIYTDPNSSDFVESHTQRPATIFVSRSFFHDLNEGQYRQICPIPDQTVVHL